jgi:UDP-N-acetylmuramate dehydrogenase
VDTTTPALLADLTTLRLGGPAGRLVQGPNEDAVVEAVRRADRTAEPLLVLAGGSNVVVADEGFPGTVLLVGTRGIARTDERDGRVRLEVQAGEPWDPLVARCVAEGLAGVECLAGIPGSVGATPIQNVGAYGQEVSETIRSVRAAVLDLRRGKGMVIDPADRDSVSAGSFFTNPVLDAAHFAALERRAAERVGDGVAPPAFPDADGRVKTSAAWLIERAGFRPGHGNPRGIAISAKHTLALTNRGAGTTAELVAFAREIADGVRETFGVELVPEPVFVGHAWPTD